MMEDILESNTMLDTRANPRVSLVFAVSSKMSSTTASLALFRNYNYGGGQKYDIFIICPEIARRTLNLLEQDEVKNAIKSPFTSEGSGRGSRHDGSFRILQRAALRASTVAPTVFKPVQMCGEMYSDGGLASNPSAIEIHEARTLFPDVPIEVVVSCGTGQFLTQKASPTFGWDGIIDQIVKSATDTSKTHHILEDILGQGHTVNGGSSVSQTKYYRVSQVSFDSLCITDYNTDAL